MNSFIQKQFQKFSGINLSIFRFLFGLVVFWEMGRLVIWNDYIWQKYLNTVFHFKFPYFEWVKQAPDTIMYIIVFGTAILALLFSIGILHKAVTPLLFLSYSYLEMIDVSYWNNHYYFYMIILFIFIFIPPSTNLIKIIKKDYQLNGNQYWQLNLLKFMIVCVLFYGGISKLSNPDWLSGRSCDYLLELELNKKGIFPSQSILDLGSWLMTWVGLFFDLIGGFLLLNKRTFWVGMLFFIPFNLLNSFLFNIGSFPYAMLSTVFLFLPFTYYDRLLGELNYEKQVRNFTHKKRIITSTVLFMAFQIVFPLRHFAIEGNVIWTGEGKLYAWHMMSAATSIKAEKFYMTAIDPNTEEQVVYPIELEKYLNKEQIRNLAKFPVLVPQFANFAKKELQIDGFRDVKIFAEIYVSKNGKPLKPIIDAYTDLCSVKVNYYKHNPWILLYLDEGF